MTPFNTKRIVMTPTTTAGKMTGTPSQEAWFAGVSISRPSHGTAERRNAAGSRCAPVLDPFSGSGGAAEETLTAF